MTKTYCFILSFFVHSVLVAQCEEVTLETITNPGPFSFSILQEGVDDIRNGPDYNGATIYFPLNASPPFAGIAIVPGYCGVETDIQEWGPFYASHGLIAITLGTNDPCADWPAARAVALLDAIETIKSENTRVGSPLIGKVDINSFAVSGWSMGGGGAQLAASIDPSLKAVIGLCPWLDLNGFLASDIIHDVPVLIFTGQNDDIANSEEYGYMHYQGTPSSTEKLYFEISNGGHGAANAPQEAEGELGVYALSWLKTFLVEDPCYCEFLLSTPNGASAYESNISCEAAIGLLPMVNKEVLLSPNPSNSDVILLNGKFFDRSYEIINESGLVVLKGLLLLGNSEISIQSLNSGTYMIRIDNQSHRFVKV